jgi:hypothetical protein
VSQLLWLKQKQESEVQCFLCAIKTKSLGAFEGSGGNGIEGSVTGVVYLNRLEEVLIRIEGSVTGVVYLNRLEEVLIRIRFGRRGSLMTRYSINTKRFGIKYYIINIARIFISVCSFAC